MFQLPTNAPPSSNRRVKYESLSARWGVPDTTKNRLRRVAMANFNNPGGFFILPVIVDKSLNYSCWPIRTGLPKCLLPDSGISAMTPSKSKKITGGGNSAYSVGPWSHGSSGMAAPQRAVAAASASRAVTHCSPAVVSSSFQKGAFVLSQSMRK